MIMTEQQTKMTTMERLELIGQKYIVIGARKQGSSTMYGYADSEGQQTAFFAMYAGGIIGEHGLQYSDQLDLWYLDIHMMAGQEPYVETLMFVWDTRQTS
jgi:hypothetical protein